MSDAGEPARAWLWDHGGPAVRLNLVRRFGTAGRARPLVDALAGSPLGSRWLAHLGRCTTIHSSAATAVENALHRLADLGFRAGDPGLDALVAPWRARLGAPVVEYGTLGRVVLAAALAHAGYLDDTVLGVADGRLALIGRDGRRALADLYDPDRRAPGRAPSRGPWPVIRREWHGADGLALPHIHDLYLLAAVGREPADLTPVVDLVASPAYQALPSGIGLVAIEGGRRLYVHGWLAHLPGLADPAATGGSPLLRLALAARYPGLARRPGIVAARRRLDDDRTPEGRWRLPAALLPEREGYWVSGAHLGLEDDRRRGVAREVESTFRVLDTDPVPATINP